jgi:hypothetical protein
LRNSISFGWIISESFGISGLRRCKKLSKSPNGNNKRKVYNLYMTAKKESTNNYLFLKLVRESAKNPIET